MEMAVAFTLMSLEHLAWQCRQVPAGLIIVDARPHGDYVQWHLPDAIWLGWEEWCAPAPPEAGPVLAQPGYWGVLDDGDPERLAARLGARGLRHDLPIVVYDEGARSWGRAARIAWMLLYFGAEAVSLLDGTWNDWLAAGHPVTTAVPGRLPATFRIVLQTERRVRLDELAAAYRQGRPPVLLDTRRREDFTGQREPYLPRRGHLPGAHLLPFLDLYDAEDRLLSRDRYLALLPAGARAAGSLVTYCEVGVRASGVALIHELHTGQIVSVYDGSLMEWGLSLDLPVVRGDTG
jgi:thiosulfate/3-mercaptopyruvate sulfurtransferase